jgi:hypothetical protein
MCFTLNKKKKKKGKARAKNKSFPGVKVSGRGWVQGSGNEAVYGGCILYPYMK